MKITIREYNNILNETKEYTEEVSDKEFNSLIKTAIAMTKENITLEDVARVENGKTKATFPHKNGYVAIIY